MRAPQQKTLVFIIGPPAVGKMTVGQELSAITGLPLFHNHVSIEAVLPVFPFGSPSFNRLVEQFRRQMFSEVADSELPGIIFTFVWGFDLPSDRRFVDEIRAMFESRGGRTVFAELWADLDTRLSRNDAPSRLAAKFSKRDVEGSRRNLLHIEQNHRVSSNGDFPLPNHLKIDNAHLSPQEVARRIAEHFKLPHVGNVG